MTKRSLNDYGSDSDQSHGKRLRRRPSFASVISEVMMTNFLNNFCTALEPMLRKVVNEEVENGLKRGVRSLSRAASLRIQNPQAKSSLQLMFPKKLSLPIFTGSKILDINSSPLQILLVDMIDNQWDPRSLPFPIKVEIVVLDGDFPTDENDTWTSAEFEKNIVRQRSGKRPLLAGNSQITIRDGFVTIGDIEFTDNSSWIRCRKKFRLGARLMQSGNKCVTICECMTEAFVVKDHRGELYKKNHPPMLDDEVWRLEKIGKEGTFHKKLALANINTVQDFLKMHIVEPSKLRKLLGNGMSDKMWEVTVKHAKTCVMGNKLYMYQGPNHSILLNPICQVVKAVINGHIYSARDSATINRAFLENFVKDAFLNWNHLEVVDGFVNETPLLTQGDVLSEYPNPHQNLERSYPQHSFMSDGSTNVAASLHAHNEYSNEWPVNSRVFFPSSTSESSSDCYLTPKKSTFNRR